MAVVSFVFFLGGGGGEKRGIDSSTFTPRPLSGPPSVLSTSPGVSQSVSQSVSSISARTHRRPRQQALAQAVQRGEQRPVVRHPQAPHLPQRRVRRRRCRVGRSSSCPCGRGAGRLPPPLLLEGLWTCDGLR